MNIKKMKEDMSQITIKSLKIQNKALDNFFNNFMLLRHLTKEDLKNKIIRNMYPDKTIYTYDGETILKDGFIFKDNSIVYFHTPLLKELKSNNLDINFK